MRIQIFIIFIQVLTRRSIIQVIPLICPMMVVELLIRVVNGYLVLSVYKIQTYMLCPALAQSKAVLEYQSQAARMAQPFQLLVLITTIHTLATFNQSAHIQLILHCILAKTLWVWTVLENMTALLDRVPMPLRMLRAHIQYIRLKLPVIPLPMHPTLHRLSFTHTKLLKTIICSNHITRL